MFRIALALTAGFLASRWLYQEVELLAPHLTPRLNALISKVELPTHDELIILVRDRWQPLPSIGLGQVVPLAPPRSSRSFEPEFDVQLESDLEW